MKVYLRTGQTVSVTKSEGELILSAIEENKGVFFIYEGHIKKAMFNTADIVAVK